MISNEGVIIVRLSLKYRLVICFHLVLWSSRTFVVICFLGNSFLHLHIRLPLLLVPLSWYIDLVISVDILLLELYTTMDSILLDWYGLANRNDDFSQLNGVFCIPAHFCGHSRQWVLPLLCGYTWQLRPRSYGQCVSYRLNLLSVKFIYAISHVGRLGIQCRFGSHLVFGHLFASSL
jgi:hypothetical protein